MKNHFTLRQQNCFVIEQNRGRWRLKQRHVAQSQEDGQSPLHAANSHIPKSQAISLQWTGLTTAT